MQDDAARTHWADGALRDERALVERPWLQILAVVLLLALIDALLARGLALHHPRHEPRIHHLGDEPLGRTQLRASLQAAVDDPGRPILLIGDSVLAGDVLASRRGDWQDQRVIDHLRRELGPASDVSFHQLALDGLLPIDVLHILAELDRLDPEGRVEVVLELNLRYFSSQYAELDTCTRAAICELGEPVFGDAGKLLRSIDALVDAAKFGHDALLAGTPVHRLRDQLDRPVPLDRVDALLVAQGEAATKPSEQEALARVREHYRSSTIGEGEQARAFELVVRRLHARRPATFFLTPLAPEFAHETLPGNELTRRHGELATLVHGIADARSGGPTLRILQLDHPIFVDALFVDHVHLEPEGNRLLALNLLHGLALPLARRPPRQDMIADEDPDRSLLHRSEEGWADGAAWQALFRHAEGVGVARDGSRIVIADTGNHMLRWLRDDQRFVERLAGKPRRAGHRDGVALEAWLDHPRDVELIDDQAWFIDGAERQRLRVVDHGYVRTLTWNGVRCPSFTAIEAHDPPGPTAEPIMHILCADNRVIAVNLARRLSKVVLKPGRDDRFVELEVLPSGELIVADEGARLWRVAPTGERELVFDNLGTETLPTGGYPFAFERVHFRAITGLEWVERYDALLVADEFAPITKNTRLQRELSERVHVRLLDLEQQQMWPWVKPLPHGDAHHLWGKETSMYASWYHQGCFALAQDDASLIWVERERSRVFRIGDGLLGLAKLGNLRSAVARVELLDPIGSSAPRRVLAEHRPDRFLAPDSFVFVMVGASLTALSDRIGNYSLGRRLEIELRRELGYRDRVRLDLFQRTVQTGGLERRLDELEHLLAEGPAADVIVVELHELEHVLDGLASGEGDAQAHAARQLDRLVELAAVSGSLVVLFDDTALASSGRDGLQASSPDMLALLALARARGLWVIEPTSMLLRELLADSPWGNQPYGRGMIHGAPWAIDRTAELLAFMMAPRVREFLHERVPAHARGGDEP